MLTLQAEAARQQLAQLQELAHAAVTSLKEATANAKQKSTAAASAAQTAAEAQKKARALETAGQLLDGAAVSLWLCGSTLHASHPAAVKSQACLSVQEGP